MYVMYNLLPYLIRRSTAPHLLPPLEDDYSPDLDPNHNIEEVSPSEGASVCYALCVLDLHSSYADPDF